ncbi:hypothetical protein D3C83_100420 [compost metagenome]
MNVFLNLATAGAKSPDLVEDPLQIPNRRRRIAIADGIYPEDAILSSEPEHDVFLAQGIAIPVVTEADDVVAFDHSFVRSPISAPRSGARRLAGG